MAQDGLQWTLLKSDLFGVVEFGHSTEASDSAAAEWKIVRRDSNAAGAKVVRRDTSKARWWVRPLAVALAAREARTLRVLQQRLPDLAGVQVPQLIHWQKGILLRSWLEGTPMQFAKPTDPLYHHQLLTLLARIHHQGITHNDLAKEPNLLVLADGSPGLLDLQLGRVTRRRNSWFRLLAHEDLRHLLKHKRTYCPSKLTERELRVLANPSWPARLWRSSGKVLYLYFTRRILHWQDREGAGDRGAS